MEFNEFKKALRSHIDGMLKNTERLFTIEVDKDALWATYLDSFPAGTNNLFRARTEHDCSSCRHFIKTFGNVVKIKDNQITTIWDFKTNDSTYQPVIDALAKFVKSHTEINLLVTKEASFGIDKNFEKPKIPGGAVLSWEHLCYTLPASLVVRLKLDETEDGIKGRARDVRNVFKRSLEEISEGAILSVLELISQNSLYKGEEWKVMLEQFLKHHKAYAKLSAEKQELYTWEQSVIVGPAMGKIRNHSIGTLLTDITEDVDLDEAVRKYEAMVAPSNYKRPKAIFTKKMLEDAQKKLEELGLMDSLGRRYATLDDITVNNILFANRDAAKRIGGSVFDEMAGGIAVNPRNFDRVDDISIDDFVKNVLPTAKKVEVLFENRLSSNLMSLIAPKVKGSKPLFKWNNGFSWAYAGNITDSMKERVKAAGGKVDGVLRFSIQWNEEGDDSVDLDAHALEPNGYEIYFGNQLRTSPCSGMLDVDIRYPGKNIAVENIVYSDDGRMKEGTYQFMVHCYGSGGSRKGFRAEIEFDGQIHSFAYNCNMRGKETVKVANVTYSRKEGFKLIEKLPSSSSSRKLWGLDTNQFQSVTVAMFSPNYWDAQDGIGNRHYLFMLKDCVNPESPNGFFNEYLKEDLMAQKRVFEALGTKMRVEDVPDQLSGLGFSSTKRNSLIVKVEGQVSRTLKISF